MASPAFDNPFTRFLDEDPVGRRAAFFGQPRLGIEGRSPIQRQFFGNLFPQIENRFLGALGRQIQEEGQPTLSFVNFLDQFFNPQQELLKAPRAQTGRGVAGLTSPLRVLWNL